MHCLYIVCVYIHILNLTYMFIRLIYTLNLHWYTSHIVFYTSENTPSYPLYVKSASWTICDGIKNVVIYKKIGVVPKPVYWDYTYGLTVDSTDNTKITKTSGKALISIFLFF